MSDGAHAWTDAEKAAIQAIGYSQSEQGEREWRSASGAADGDNVFVQLGKALGVTPVPTEEAVARIEDYRRLPSTETLTGAVDFCRARVKALQGRTFGRAHQHAVRLLRAAERDLRWGQERDEIAATRPDGCRCLGDGIIVGESLSAFDGDTFHGRGRRVDYCPCDDGELRRLADAEAAEYAQHERARRALADLFDEPTRRALGAYCDYTLGSYAAALAAYSDVERARGERLVARLFAWVGAEGAPWLVLCGVAGTGKTGLAIACVRLLAECGHRARFVTADGLLERIRATYGRGNDGPREADVLNDYRDVPVLLLDDFGVGRPANDWVEAKLFDVVNSRYTAERRTIVTTNLDAAELEEYAGPRIVSRLHHRTGRGAWWLNVDGPELRNGPAGLA